MVKKMKKIAIPATENDLDSEIVPHFGHTPAFLVVEIDENKQINSTSLIQNPPHAQGGCMRPVMLLKNSGVTDAILGGIGQRPLMGFVEVGIEPYLGVRGTIRQNIESFLQGNLQKMMESSCSHH